LREPNVPFSFIIGIGLFSGVFWASIIGGTRKKFWTAFAIAGGIASLLILFFSLTHWFLNPSLGPIVIGGLAVGIAFGITQISVGLINKAALRASLTMAGVVFVAYFPANWIFDNHPGALSVFGIYSVIIAIAVFVALSYSKIDRGPIIRTFSSYRFY
jgi:peptide/nickel transport system permease protein